MRRRPAVRTFEDAEFTDAELDRRHIELRIRSRARLDISADDVARMVAEFAASRGITPCKPAYAALRA